MAKLAKAFVPAHLFVCLLVCTVTSETVQDAGTVSPLQTRTLGLVSSARRFQHDGGATIERTLRNEEETATIFLASGDPFERQTRTRRRENRSGTVNGAVG